MGQSIEEMLLANRPRVLGKFAATQAPTIEKRDHMTAGGFELACAKCGSQLFHVFEVSSQWRARDGSEQASLVGLRTESSACGEVADLFDAARDGYDGEHGHLKHLDGGARSEEPLRENGTELGPRRLRAWFIYNIAPEELSELAGACGVGPLDLFDFFILEGRKTEQDPWEELREYECA